MAISFVAKNQGTCNYASSMSITKPTGTVDGDVMLAVVGGSPSTPSGWTRLCDINSGTSSLLNVRVFVKVAASEGSSYSFTLGGSVLACGVIATYRGVDNTTPVDTTNSKFTAVTSTTTNYNTASTTATAGQWGVTTATAYEFGSSTARTWTEGSGTERADFAVTNAGSPDNCNLSITDASLSAGTFTRTQTRSASGNGGMSAAILLNPANTAVNANAGAVTATTTAQGASVAIGPTIGSASATASAGQPVTFAQAGIASASASAKTPAVGFGAIPGYASASAVVQSVAYRAHADCALAVGIADHSQPAAPGGLASAVVSVHVPTLTGTNVGATPGTARAFAEVHPTDLNVPSGTADQTAASAYDVSVGISGSADEVAATASTHDAQVAVSINTNSASTTVSVKQPTLTLHSTPGVEGFFVSVNVPQVSVVINGNPAQLTRATGTAYGVTLRSEVVGASSAAASVNQPTMFFGSTRVIKVKAQTRNEVVAPDPGNRVIVVGAK